MDSCSGGGDFASLKRLLMDESWNSPTRASALLCRMLDDSLSWWCDDDGLHTQRTVGLGNLFFSFTRYFATAITAKRLSDANRFSAEDDDGAIDLSMAGTNKARNTQIPGAMMRQEFPSLHELWRQPSMVAAMERLAETVWSIQAALHSGGGGGGDDNPVGRCPLCYAAGIDHVLGTDALWSLLELHAVYRVAFRKPVPFKSTNVMDASASVAVECSDLIELDVASQRLLWIHATAVCRNAIWNGAIQTTRFCIEHWIYAGTHGVLFTTPKLHSQDGRIAAQVGGELHSFRSFLLSQCCLLVQDEVAFEAYAAANRHDDDDGEHLSSTSLSSLGSRGDAGLHASLIAMWEAASVFESSGGAAVFASLTMTTPHYSTGGVPLLHWVCEKGYEACARLLLTTWVAVYRDRRLQLDAWKPPGHDERRLRINFTEPYETSASLKGERAPKAAIARAIRCTAVNDCRGVLSYALRGGNLSIVRQLFLFGASSYQCGSGVGVKGELSELLRDPGTLLDRVGGSSSSCCSLHERVRGTLCASAAADALANAASRLWREKVCSVSKSSGSNDTEAAVLYRRAHDSVVRTALAALEFDPHNVVARTTLRDVLMRKVVDSRTSSGTTGENSMQQKRYDTAVIKMCRQLSTSSTEYDEEMRSFLGQIAPCTALSVSPSEGAASGGGGCDVSGGGSSAATVATDERQQSVYALVNISETLGAKATVMMHPLWVRLPRDVNFQKSLELAGGMYGVVEGVVPLVAPVERGDLVIFSLHRKFGRFDVTRVVHPREGVIVEVPCVLQGGDCGSETVATCVLRCAMVPAPVYEFDDDRIASDPLQWLEAAGPNVTDAVDQILSDRLRLQWWSHIVHRGRRPMWFRDIPVDLHDASLWRLDRPSCGGRSERIGDASVVFATAVFPFLSDVGAEEADDPFGASSESVFILQGHYHHHQQQQQQHEKDETREAVGMYGVVGVFPTWGWN